MSDSAKQVGLYGGGGQTKAFCYVVGRPSFYVPQYEHVALPVIQRVQRLPDSRLPFLAPGVFLARKREPGSKLIEVARPSAALPPRRALPVAAGVDRHPHQPRLPHLWCLVGADSLEGSQENFLGDVFSLIWITEQQPAQVEDPGLMRAVNPFVVHRQCTSGLLGGGFHSPHHLRRCTRILVNIGPGGEGQKRRLCLAG